jgi:hypothetical protein
VGFSASGVSAVGFIVKIGAINQNVDPSVAPCRNQRIAVSGCSGLTALACVAWCLDAHLGHAIATQTTTSSADSLLALSANNDVSVTIPIGNGP